MFIINFIDGSMSIEGSDVKNWDEVPHDKKILSVSLSNGGNLTDTLMGYDHYICCYEGVMSMPVALGDAKNYDKVSNKVTAQKLYGIRYSTNAKRRVRQVSDTLWKKIDGEYQEVFKKAGKNIYILNAKNKQLGDVKKLTEELLKEFDDAEITELSMSINKRNVSWDNFSQDKKYWRDGVQADLPKDFDEFVKEKITPIQKGV